MAKSSSQKCTLMSIGQSLLSNQSRFSIDISLIFLLHIVQNWRDLDLGIQSTLFQKFLTQPSLVPSRRCSSWEEEHSEI